MVSEDFLHFVWRFRLFDQLALVGAEGEPIRTVQVGEHNHDAGPDFLFAKVRIGGAEWAGHVEIHVNGADWHRHGHHTDKAYNSVVLHVVWENPTTVRREDGTAIPTLELRPFVDPDLYRRYRQIVDNLSWIPCSDRMPGVPEPVKFQTLQRMIVERMEDRYDRINGILRACDGDWERVLFAMLCRSFGMKVNAETFLALGMLVPLTLIRKYADDPLKIEALFLGQAGFLDRDFAHPHPEKLKHEYQYLKKLHQLTEADRFAWRFMRMRPHNFPTIRLAQLAALYTAYPSLFSMMVDMPSADAFQKALADVDTSPFWHKHFSLEKASSEHTAKLSGPFIAHLIINAFAPVLFGYGKYTDNPAFREKSMDWLEAVKPESNAISRKFREIGLRIPSAAESQAVLQLKKQYCDRKKCLECPIGVKLMLV